MKRSMDVRVNLYKYEFEVVEEFLPVRSLGCKLSNQCIKLL